MKHLIVASLALALTVPAFASTTQAKTTTHHKAGTSTTKHHVAKKKTTANHKTAKATTSHKHA